MNNRRIENTLGFGRARAMAQLRCIACDHKQVLNQAELRILFPRVMPIDMAQKKLRCSVCGAKRGRITPIPELGRG
jgi:ribosomal protein S27E